MALSALELAELVDAFADSYSNEADLDELVRLTRAHSLAHAALGNSLRQIIVRLLVVADEQGWMLTLLNGAVVHRPASALLRQARDRWVARSRPLGMAADPYKALLLPGRRVMLDREKLRGYLAGLHGNQGVQGARVLVVDGEAESGKSYSLQYIGYLAEVQKTFSFTALDMERVPRNDQNKVSPAGLVQAITQALLPDEPPYAPPADGNYTTWIDQYCAWLAKHLTRQLPANAQRWLVIDSFRKVTIDQAAHDLIVMLAMRTYLELPMLRLVLLNYGDAELLKARVVGGVDSEAIEPITTKHLRTFFALLLMDLLNDRGTPLDGNDKAAVQKLSTQIAAMADRVLAGAASSSEKRLQALARLTWQEVELLLPSSPPEGLPPGLIDILIGGPGGLGAAGGAAAPVEGP